MMHRWRMMRENPSEYWRSENQHAYRQAVERSLGPQAQAPAPQDQTVADEVPAAIAGTAAAPAPAPAARAAPPAGQPA
jgi:hypothetical protein